MIKEITFSTIARERLKSGIDMLANAVKATLGPKGRNVVIEKTFGPPHVTKDGVTVARSITLEGSVENMGAQMVKEAASKTADVAGDGTTTATVLAQSMISSGMKYVAAGANPMDLKRGIDKAVEAVVVNLADQSESIGEDYNRVQQVGAISANNNEEIGTLIADAMERVTKDGVITIEESRGTDTYVEEALGMQFGNGYLSPQFVNNKSSMTVEYEDAYILVCDSDILNIKDIIPFLELVAASKKPLLIISNDITPPVLRTLAVNSGRSGLQVVAVKSPGFGELRSEMLKDIAILTGGRVISEDSGYDLKTISLDDLGIVGKLTVSANNTTLVDGQGYEDEINDRIESIKNSIEEDTTKYAKIALKGRLAKLVGGVAVLYVGGTTVVEMKEKKDRVDDALHATRAAVEEGIVEGGGVALIRAISVLDAVDCLNEDEALGVNIVAKALEAPLKVIATNAGMDGAVILNDILRSKKAIGYNAKTDKFEDLKKAGVIDPTKVTRVAIQNAGSIAGMVLTTDVVISNTITIENDVDPMF
jgi:chaperonin GroEL